MDNEEIVGAVLRTQTNINPIFVSIGHRIALSTACYWVLRLASQYRLPETTRLADHVVRQRLSELKTS
jgi:deoxyribonuclease V